MINNNIMLIKETINQIKTRIIGTNTDDRLTLLPGEVLDNVEYCIEKCKEESILGDFVETGVWRGGAVILAYNIYKLTGQNRKVYCYDSFEGLPKPDPQKYPVDEGDRHWMDNMLKVSVEEVRENFKKFKEADESVVFVKGWFKDTIPLNNIEKISILRLDGDMYESTIDVLNYLYPKLSPGGFCIIDDYGHVGAKTAVADYRAKHNINDEIVIISRNPVPGNTSAYWRKK